jgi:hypothetical protein
MDIFVRVRNNCMATKYICFQMFLLQYVLKGGASAGSEQGRELYSPEITQQRNLGVGQCH